jgi:hypothetical protein
LPQQLVKGRVAGRHSDLADRSTCPEEPFHGVGTTSIGPKRVHTRKNCQREGAAPPAVEDVHACASFDQQRDGRMPRAPGGNVECRAVGCYTKIAVTLLEDRIHTNTKIEEKPNSIRIADAGELREQLPAVGQDMLHQLWFAVSNRMDCGRISSRARANQVFDSLEPNRSLSSFE